MNDLPTQDFWWLTLPTSDFALTTTFASTCLLGCAESYALPRHVAHVRRGCKGFKQLHLLTDQRLGWNLKPERKPCLCIQTSAILFEKSSTFTKYRIRSLGPARMSCAAQTSERKRSSHVQTVHNVPINVGELLRSTTKSARKVRNSTINHKNL